MAFLNVAPWSAYQRRAPYAYRNKEEFELEDVQERTLRPVFSGE